MYPFTIDCNNKLNLNAHFDFYNGIGWWNNGANVVYGLIALSSVCYVDTGCMCEVL